GIRNRFVRAQNERHGRKPPLSVRRVRASRHSGDLDHEVVAVWPDESDTANELIVAPLGQPRAHRAGPSARVLLLGWFGDVGEVADAEARSAADRLIGLSRARRQPGDRLRAPCGELRAWGDQRLIPRFDAVHAGTP